MSRLAKLRGVCSLSLARIRAQLRTKQARSCVLGIGIAVGLLLVVTSLSLGLAAGTVVESGDADYRVTAGDSASSASVEVDDPQLGSARAAVTMIDEHEAVTGVTPVLVAFLPAEAPNGNEEIVVVVGVVSGNGIDRVSGTQISALSAGDPAHETGTPTEEAVVSDAAAQLLDVDEGDSIRLDGDHRFDVIDRSDVASGGPSGNIPVVAVQLSELQRITGAHDGDLADEIHVRADEDVRSFLEGVYPDVTVRTDSIVDTAQEGDEQALAVALVAAVLGIGVGIGFTATSVGLLVANDRRQLAVLGAIGISVWHRRAMVLTLSIAVTLIGGLVGIALGAVGVGALNRIVGPWIGIGRLAVTDPVLGIYGLLVAGCIGVVTAPYLLYVAERGSLLEEINR